MPQPNILTKLILLIYYFLFSLILIFIPRRFRCKDIKGQTVLITGGGSGIGRLLALRFAQHGARIIVWDVNPNGTQETVKMVEDQGGEAFGFHCDVSQPKDVYNTAEKVKKEVGKVDILVNNAGVVTGKKFLDCSDEEIKKSFDVNTLSHFWTSKAFLPDMMVENMGHIVSISSIAGYFGLPKLTDYCASKSAVIKFEESLRNELRMLKYDGIKSTLVAPFFTNTGMFDGVYSRFFSILTPEYVADNILSAVLTNQEVLVLPGYFSIFAALQMIVSIKVNYTVRSLLGFEDNMENFIGRKKKE